jgi:hypothetical protein
MRDEEGQIMKERMTRDLGPYPYVHVYFGENSLAKRKHPYLYCEKDGRFMRWDNIDDPVAKVDKFLRDHKHVNEPTLDDWRAKKAVQLEKDLEELLQLQMEAFAAFVTTACVSRRGLHRRSTRRR